MSEEHRSFFASDREGIEREVHIFEVEIERLTRLR